MEKSKMKSNLQRYYKDLKKTNRIEKMGIWYWVLSFGLTILSALIVILGFNWWLGI